MPSVSLQPGSLPRCVPLPSAPFSPGEQVHYWVFAAEAESLQGLDQA